MSPYDLVSLAVILIPSLSRDQMPYPTETTTEYSWNTRFGHPDSVSIPRPSALSHRVKELMKFGHPTSVSSPRPSLLPHWDRYKRLHDMRDLYYFRQGLPPPSSSEILCCVGGRISNRESIGFIGALYYMENRYFFAPILILTICLGALPRFAQGWLVGQVPRNLAPGRCLRT